MTPALSSRSNRGNYRKTGSQFPGQAWIIQPDLYGNALHDFCVVAGSIVWWQQSELRSAGGSNLDYLAMNDLTGVRVYTNFRTVPNFKISELRFAIVGLHPLRDVNERDHLRSWRYELSDTNLTLAHGAVSRRENLGVGQIHDCSSETSLLGAQVCLKLQFLRGQNSFPANFGFGSQFAAV